MDLNDEPLVTEEMLPRGLCLAMTWADLGGRAEVVGIALTSDPPRPLTMDDLKRVGLSGVVARQRREHRLQVRFHSGRETAAMREFNRMTAEFWAAGRKPRGRPPKTPDHFERVSSVAMRAWREGRNDYVRAVGLAFGGTEVHSVASHKAAPRAECSTDTCNYKREFAGLPPKRGGVTNYRAAARWVSVARSRGWPVPPTKGDR